MKYTSAIVLQADAFAENAHRGQFRKYTGAPYITHPRRVAEDVSRLPNVFDAMICAALLHDVVEDCGVHCDTITAWFGIGIGTLVGELTNVSKLTGAGRVACKEMDRQRLTKVSVSARRIKLLDRIDNLEEMSGATYKFLLIYVWESELLLRALKGTDMELEKRLRAIIDFFLREWAVAPNGNYQMITEQIKPAQEMLATAALNVHKSAVLRKIAGNLNPWNSIRLDESVWKEVFKDETPSWRDVLLIETLRTGCKVYADKLDAEASEFATRAANILSGKRDLVAMPISPSEEQQMQAIEDAAETDSE
jgi:hypothetical protein